MASNNLPAFITPFGNASNDMLIAILDQSPDCIKVISPDGTIEYMNRNGQRAMEIDNFYELAGKKWTALWPKESSQAIESALATARTERVARFEAFCPTALGTPRWWDVRVSPFLGLDGSVLGFVASSRDVTEHKQLQALLEAKGDEMRHLLRNNHVAAGSLATALLKKGRRRSELARELMVRLSRLAEAQSKSIDERDPKVMRTLVPQLLVPYATEDCPIVIGALPEANLSQISIDMLRLMLCELAVNSTRHGALSARGQVTVACTVAGGRARITWSERSNRTVCRSDIAGGQGLSLLKRLAALHDADLTVAWDGSGVDVQVSLQCA